MLTRSFTLTAIAVLTMVSCSTHQFTVVPGAGDPAFRHDSAVVETVLYSFGSHVHDGAAPQARLIDVKGKLYGTTYAGGTYHRGRDCARDNGCGTVFSITPSGTETVVYGLFAGVSQGANPAARLIDVNGELFGTTAFGGFNECEPGYGCGTVFSVTTTGAEKLLHRFHGSDGEEPLDGLTNVSGTFYGTTAAGGANGYGTVFSLTPDGAYHLLYSFAGESDGEDAEDGLVKLNGKLYGTTSGGGKYGFGTVFSITTSGSEKVLHQFNGIDGKYPEAGLIPLNGKLYGTTYYGGGHNRGTVFSITTTGTEKVLYRFAGGRDGAYPYAGLSNVKGTLYGTTQSGGGAGCGSGGCGTVFSVRTTGAETVLHAFEGGDTDGQAPQAGLIYLNGTFYGTTESGGTYGDGTVYTVTGF